MTPVPKTIREQIRQRAGQRCEYCRKPEGVSNYSHQVDHIIAAKHEGTSELGNLPWACFQCNTTKGSDIASYDNRMLTRLFNPRTENWDDHFEMDGAIIRGKTAVGRVTVRTLQLNHSDQIETRQRLLNVGLW